MSTCSKCNVSHPIPSDHANGTPLGAPCTYCGGDDVRVVMRLKAKPLGSFSLAGAQMKFSAHEAPYAICGNCGHTSEGKAA